MKPGHHFLNSISQFNITLVGTTMRCGPQTPAAKAEVEVLNTRYAKFLYKLYKNSVSYAFYPTKRSCIQRGSKEGSHALREKSTSRHSLVGMTTKRISICILKL